MRKLIDILHDFRYRRYLPYRLPSGHARVYFYHIRKTAGTSLSSMIMSSFDDKRRDPDALWTALWAAHRHRLLVGDKLFVAGERRLIEKGNYFYATSHLAAHEISLPENTFTVTCLRDPVERVVSHYRMLLGWKKNNSPALKKEDWLGTDFIEFLQRIPKAHLLRQLYMFSARYDVAEAFDRICRLDYWFFTKDLDQAAEVLARQIGYKHRATLRSNVSEFRFVPSTQERAYLEDLLGAEIDLYTRLSSLRNESRRASA